MDTSYMEVRFDEYCKKCRYMNVVGSDEPCSSCISRPFMFGTTKPKNFAEKRVERPIRTKNKRYSDTNVVGRP